MSFRKRQSFSFKTFLTLLWFLAIGFAGLWEDICFADLKVSPTRILIDETHLSATVALRHLGQKKTRYRVSTRFYDMNESGALTWNKEANRQNSNYLGELLRFSPKIVTLDPSEEQVVRIIFKKTPDLPNGEYRCHLVFETFEEGDAELIGTSAGDSKVSTTLMAHRAIAIPVVVRLGALSASVSIEGQSIEKVDMAGKAGAVARFRLKVDGGRSVHGDVFVRVTDAEGKQQVIGALQGISVYTPQRLLVIPVEELTKIPPDSKLTASFTDLDINTTVQTDIKFEPR